MLLDKTIGDIEEKFGDVYNKSSVIDDVITNFYLDLLSENDRMLVNFIFSENPTQEKLDELLSKWDIEVAGGNKAILLAYFMKDHPELRFTPYEEPRLNGLLKFYRFKNLEIISHFTKIGKELNKVGIPFMLLKGGAMKHLRPDLPRVMGDTDILVDYNKFFKALDAIEKIGYKNLYERKRIIHAADLHYKESEDGICDLHRYIYMSTGYERNINKDLFARARQVKAFGVDVLIPSNEDMLFIALVNLAKNLRDATSKAGILYAIYDCKFLVETKPNFDWNIVIENAKKTKTEVQAGFALRFINNIASHILPESLRQINLFEKDIKDYCTVLMYNRFYLHNIRMKSKEIKVIDVLKNPFKIFAYLSIKPKYAFLKSIRKHPNIIRFYFKLNPSEAN